MNYLYRGAAFECGGGTECAESLLKTLDFGTLARFCRRNAGRVYAYQTTGKRQLSARYRGRDLLGCRAVRIYDAADSCDFGADAPFASRAFELWLKENGRIVAVSCVSVNFGEDAYATEYREILGVPLRPGVRLDLDALTENLRGMRGSP